ncbi:MAG TPA: transglycosylase domain-containing protein [Solirubrobacteraceae bacterium]|jgi:penicillin-binding protein 1A
MSDLTAEPIPFEPPRVRPRIKKLRVLVVAVPLLLLALISTVFGMMMAVAADVNGLDTTQVFREAHSSRIVDVRGEPLGILSDQNRVVVPLTRVSMAMQNAVVAVEDRRFYSNDGVDVRGIARAFIADLVSGRTVQGGSTITQQFVKNRLDAQGDRTVFQKLREAALAFHLSRKWSKQKVLSQYLNSIYFGNGAYGVESAARTYFGHEPGHEGCGDIQRRPCSAELRPHEAALLAGLIASPTAFDPVTHPAAAITRRNLVLRKMLEQHKLTFAEYRTDTLARLPSDVEPPRERAPTPASAYFTTWVRSQVVDRFGAQRAFEGGLRVRTTLDLKLEQAAEAAIANRLPFAGGPTASLVAIDNRSGEVRAMVGGRDYNEQAFNLATQGQRQPGSAFKPFILAEALKDGIAPGSVWPSRKRVFDVPGSPEKFVVNNYEGAYAGATTLARALATSDNSVFAAVGIQVGTRKIARLAHRMGIRTPVSRNYAITLGGLRQGVTPLDMAHAYETLATGGKLVSGTLGAREHGPVGIREVQAVNGTKLVTVADNKPQRLRVLPQGVADETAALMTAVVTSGTGRRAAVPGLVIAGKTGTTEDYGDAWFVGFTRRYTVAVWVGYPNNVRSMKTEYRGDPVAGGTFPAEIFHDFMTRVRAIEKERAAEQALKEGKPPPTDTTETLPAVPAATAPAGPAPPQTTPAEVTPAPPPKEKQGAKPTPPSATKPKPAPAAPAPAPAQPPAAGPGDDSGGANPGGATAPG